VEFVVALDGIPEEVSGDKDVGIVLEEGIKTTLEGDDSAKLLGLDFSRCPIIK